MPKYYEVITSLQQILIKINITTEIEIIYWYTTTKKDKDKKDKKKKRIIKNKKKQLTRPVKHKQEKQYSKEQ